METVLVMYKEMPIGELNFLNGKYVYTAYKQYVAEAFEKGYPIYLYNMHESFESETLPECLAAYLPKSKEDYPECEFFETDTDYEKLLKIAQTPLSDKDIHFGIKG